MFTRLLFYATVLLRRTEQEARLMPFGYLLDLWEVYLQYNGMAKPFKEQYIDDVFAGVK